MGRACVLSSAMVLCALTFGCAHVTSIRHPLSVGVVDPNEVVIEDQRREDELALPSGTLDDTASLIELSPSRVCFHLTRWSVEPSRRGELLGLSLTMFGDSEELRAQPVSLAPGRRFEHEVPGSREVMTPGKCLYHALGMCARWAVHPRTEHQSFDYTIAVNEATACFLNDDVITQTSRFVRLEVHGGGERQRFEWSLDHSS